MRLAFLSDIHGNIQALTAVKRFLNDQIVNKVIVVGDLVGYGANPGPVIDFVRREEWDVYIGRSDLRVAMVLSGFVKGKGISDQVLAWTRETLAPDQMEYLRNLPHGGRLRTNLGRIKWFHSHPTDPEGSFDLNESDHRLEAMADQVNARLIIVGGMHVPFVRTVDDTIFVDPGSVGLTLNHEPGADVAIVDCVGRKPKVSLHKVTYDYASCIFDLKAWGLPDVIGDVIRTGKMGA